MKTLWILLRKASRMALKTDLDEDGIISEINMTPFIDIMLVLLIIFMVTSTVSLESGLDIDLPTTKGKVVAKDEDAVIVSLNKEGKISVQGKPVSDENLSIELRESIKLSSSKLVIFEGDKKSSLGKTIEIMDIAKEAGAKNFAIAAEEI